MRSVSIRHWVASRHGPIDPPQRPGRWPEGSSRTTTGCHRHTQKRHTHSGSVALLGFSFRPRCGVLCGGAVGLPGHTATPRADPTRVVASPTDRDRPPSRAFPCSSFSSSFFFPGTDEDTDTATTGGPKRVERERGRNRATTATTQHPAATPPPPQAAEERHGGRGTRRRRRRRADTTHNHHNGDDATRATAAQAVAGG